MDTGTRVFGAVMLTAIMGVGIAFCVGGSLSSKPWFAFLAAFPMVILGTCAIINWSNRP